MQLAGHQGNFKAGSEPGTVLKKLTPKEEISFKELMQDVLRPYVPEFKGVVIGDEEECKPRHQPSISYNFLINHHHHHHFSSISSTTRSFE